MTQIKLRRDTAANFTSKNPVLGIGEPAYETDTKKLKIGDGTTTYTQLEYFSSGGGGSTNITATLPLKIVNGVISLEVDGQTIQIVDGKLHANLDELGNEVNTLAGDVAGVQADLLNKQDKSTAVTTDTAQTISGQKEFNKTVLFLSNNDLIRAQQSAAYRNGAGLSMGANSTSTDGGVFAPQWKIYNTAGDVDRTETIITTYNQSKLSSTNFNTANKLVKLDSDGKLPAIDGSNLTNLPSGSAPTNMVTTDTAQTISGNKEFTGITTISNGIKIPLGTQITTPNGLWLMKFWTGFIGLGTSTCPLMTYDGSNYYLHDRSIIAGDGIKITKPSTDNIQISSTIGNMAAYVTEEFVNGTEGYRVWSNGRCEQWGSFNNPKSITLLKSYANTNYMLLAYVTLKTSDEAYNGVFGTKKTTTGFTVDGFAGTLNDAWIIQTCGTVNWYTSGELAS